MSNGSIEKEFGGVAEVANLLKISRQRVRVLRTRPGFPEPVAELAAGPVWDLSMVRRWGDQPRSQGGRPSSSNNLRLLGDRFRLEVTPIGNGGFADVFRAVDLRALTEGAESVVAVKVLRAVDSGDGQTRFLRELRLLRDLHHPNIIEVIEAGADDAGLLWYAMPLAKGSLADELRDVRDDAAIVEILRQVGAGLTYLHGEGVWHRDVTPMNVLRTASGAWALSDFGLAREMERRTPTLTTTTVPLGTFLYQAPETMTEIKSANHRADIYGLGKVLEALAVGGHPLPGAALPEGPFRPIVRKATSFNPDDRYQSVSAMLADVERAVTAPGGRWDMSDQALERLRAEIASGSVADVVLDELMALVAVPTELGIMDADVTRIVTELSVVQIQTLRSRDCDAFIGMFRTFTSGVTRRQFPFSYCDELADFISRIVISVTDNEILTMALQGLVVLGAGHNRFHVRTECATILQQIQSNERALVALDALRSCSRDDVSWSVEGFVRRSLHPIIRDGLDEFLAQATNG